MPPSSKPRSATCTDCKKPFPVEKLSGRIPDRCRNCAAEYVRTRSRERQYRWREANPEKWKAVRDRANAKRLADPEHRAQKRRNEVRRNHGIEPEEYDGLIAAQDGRCAICRRLPGGRANGRAREGHPPSLHVDHDHRTGRIRGLLCSNCNTMLGLAGDDVVVLAAAIEYLKRST